MLYFILLTFSVAIFFLWQASKSQKRLGLPRGRLIYTDTGSWGKVDEPLYDSFFDLTGKPDYLIDSDGLIMPVEVKTGRTPPMPYDAHIFQLAAYCLLVKRNFGRRPSHGIIKYPQRVFEIEYTPELEASLIDLLHEIRLNKRKRDVSRSHVLPARCAHCGFRSVCDQRI